MSEKPILFNTEMVKAILEGHKTQTRRVIKQQPKSKIVYNGNGDWIFPGPKHIKCQFGYADDELWVKETFCIGEVAEGDSVEGQSEGCYVSQCKGENTVIYKEQCLSQDVGVEDVTWKPSIYMPREASRIQLKVKNIRVERVCDITEEDAIAEGIHREWDGTAYWYKNYSGRLPSNFKNHPVASFQTLWDSINAKRGFGWMFNPWVWIPEFEIISSR